MSQELLFFLMITLELFAIVILYSFWVIPAVSKKTIIRWERKMLDGDFDVPLMLENYTEHLLLNFVEVVKKIVPEIMGGYLSAGTRQLKADPENVMAVATAEFLEELPLPARLVANSLLPKLQEALNKAPPSVKEAVVRYSPGLNKP